MAKRRKRRKKRNGVVGNVIAVLLLVALTVLYGTYQSQINDFIRQMEEKYLPASAVGVTAPVQDGLAVSYLDVGQGDAILLVSGKETMLIDGGTRDAGGTVRDALTRRGITRLNYVVATHSHEDHIGGLPTVLKAIPADTCLISDDVTNTKSYDNFLTALQDGNVMVEMPSAGEQFSFGDCTVTVLGPIRRGQDHNDNSLVLRVTCGEVSFLFTGDMETEEEESLLNAGTDLDTDVLKVAHHGSEYTTSGAFLRRSTPSLAVISCGKDNSYGHPHSALLKRLKQYNIPTLRTDEEGTIIVTTDGTDYSVTTEQEEKP